MVHVQNVCYVGPIVNPIENDLFNTRIDNVLKDKSIVISDNTVIEFKNNRKYKCSFGELPKIGTIKYLKLRPEEKIFLIINIECDNERKVIINFGIGHKTKVWVNDTFICSGLSFPDCFLAMTLCKGSNIFFIECESKRTASRLAMRINDYDDELFGIHGKLASNIDERMVTDTSIIRKDISSLKNANTYDFIVLPKDMIKIPTNSPLSITVKDEHGSVLSEFQSYTGMPIKYDIKQDQNIYLSFTAKLATSSGDKIEVKHYAWFGNISEELNKLKDEYEEIKNTCPLYEEDEINIECRLHNIERISKGIIPKLTIDDDWGNKSVINEVFELREIFKSIQNGIHFEELAKQTEINSIYYRSYLDDQLEMYNICLPSGYNDQKKYPLLVFLPAVSPDALWDQIKPFLDEEVIMADVPLRGWSLGSYMGEASFFEVLYTLFEKYNVDLDRVYLVGFSNGGHATWTLAQAHPDLFAAIAPVAGGIYAPNANNLSNVNVLNIQAEYDSPQLIEASKAAAKTLSKYGNYKEIIASCAAHNSIWVAMYSKYVIQWLLTHKKTRFPKKIFYRTERIRHNKAYWIEILNIEPGKKYCEVEGELVNDTEINMNVNNVSEFILKIPDFMRKDQLVININSSDTIYPNSMSGNVLGFKKIKDKYHLFENLPKRTPRMSYQGMGLLDIYMDRVKIVTPSNYMEKNEKQTIMKIASGFSRPRSYGANPSLRVNYPMIKETELTENDIRQSNLILVGLDESSKFIQEIKVGLPFYCDRNGYEYKNHYIKGDYSLLFIVPNPLNSIKSILFVCSNNYKLFEKNVFTRNIIIPTYFNGFHPFLNNEAIIYDGGKYSTVYQMGDDINEWRL